MIRKKFIIRLDDISWDMNYENFMKVKEIFLKFDIRPIIGVIPNNNDKKLKDFSDAQLEENEFWKEIKYLQDKWKWDIALHGYDHVYISNDAGMLKRNNQSEFSGIAFDIQMKKIKNGKEILIQHGLKIKAFMAPSHSFDLNTIKAIKENSIYVITDGFSAFPYYKYGVQFIPQLRSWPDKRGIGIDTICYHCNSMTEGDILNLSRFIEDNYMDIISFSDLIDVNLTNKIIWKIGNFITWLPVRMRLLYTRGKRWIHSKYQKTM